MSSSILKSVLGGSRKVHIYKGGEESVDKDSTLYEEKRIKHDDVLTNKNILVAGSEDNLSENISNDGLSLIENFCNMKIKVKTLEGELKTMETIKSKREEDSNAGKVDAAELVDYLSSIKEEEEKIVDDLDQGEVFTFTNKPLEKKEKEVRCIQPTFGVMTIDINNSFGTLLFGEGFRERYPIILADPHNVYTLLSFLGFCLGFLGASSKLPSFYGVLLLFAIPTYIIVFMSMNIPLLKLLSFRFFTILKSAYVLIFMISGVILSRERENSWAINTFFIMCGITMFILGIFVDAMYLITRESSMKMGSIIVSIFLGLQIVLLHTGSLDVSDYRIEFMGHFNFSVVTLMSTSLTNLFWLNLEIVYVAFMYPKRLVTLFSPISNKKIVKKVSQLIRGAASASSIEVFPFPPTIVTLDDKINYIKERLKEWNSKCDKLYAVLSVEEKREMDNNMIIMKESRRNTKNIANQMKALVHSREKMEQLNVITTSFVMQEIDSQDTLGKLLFGSKTARWISKFGLLFHLMWLIGVVLNLLAINKVVEDVYSLSVILCIPTLSNFSVLNISILKKLVFQFETIFNAVSSFVFCLCGAILLREREYNWCYFFFFAAMYVIGQFVNLGDSLPGSSRYINMIIGSFSGLIVYFIILVGVYVDKLEGQDFVIPFFGNLNVTVSNQCANAGFTFIIFMLKNLCHTFIYPDKLLTLKGRLYFSKMMASEVEVIQSIHKVSLQSKNKKSINT